MGDYPLGQIFDEHDLEFQFRNDFAPQHTLLIGASGFGKTRTAMLLARQASENYPVTVIDPKGSYWGRNFIHINWRGFRFNPLLPSKNMPVRDLINYNATVTTDRSGGLIAFKGSLIKHFAELYAGWNGHPESCPCFDDLLAQIERQKVRRGCEEELLKKNIVIHTTGMISELASFFIEMILIWLFTYRIYNRQKGELRQFLIVDEAQSEIYARQKEWKQESAPVISSLTAQVRETGLALVVLAQRASALIPEIVNDSAQKGCFNLGDGNEVDIMGKAMGLYSSGCGSNL